MEVMRSRCEAIAREEMRDASTMTSESGVGKFVVAERIAYAIAALKGSGAWMSRPRRLRTRPGHGPKHAPRKDKARCRRKRSWGSEQTSEVIREMRCEGEFRGITLASFG